MQILNQKRLLKKLEGDRKQLKINKMSLKVKAIMLVMKRKKK